MDFSDMRWIKRVIISEISLSYLILSENRYLQGICTGWFSSDGMISLILLKRFKSLILIQMRLYLSPLPTSDEFALATQLWYKGLEESTSKLESNLTGISC